MEIGSSKSFLRIPNFPFYGAKVEYDDAGKMTPITPLKVKAILESCPLIRRVSACACNFAKYLSFALLHGHISYKGYKD